MRKTATAQKKKPDVSLVRYPGGVSKSESAHPRYPFVVRWPENGKRMVKWFTNDTEAIAWAKEKSAEAGELGAGFGSLAEDERAAVAAFRALVAKHENPKPPPLAMIVKDFAKRWEASRAGATVATAVPEFIAAKKKEGRSDAHLATIGVRLGRFVKDHGERVLPSFTTAEISDYVLNLRGLVLKPDKRKPAGRMRKDGTPVKRVYRPAIQRTEDSLSLETRAGYRRALHALFEWARKRGMVTANPVTDADKPEALPKLPGVLTPEDAEAYFAALGEHAPALVPFWAVRAFAGIREAEAVRMDWKMIDLTACKITLPATITKTRKSREIEIQPVLAAFLTPHAKQSGPLCAYSPMARRWHLRLALRSVPGLVPPRNWARHSFATYHLLAFRHAGETSLQLGHKGGPELLHSTYAGVGTEAQALAFWAIRPATKPENVVPMGTPENAEKEKPEALRKSAR
jgi:integrase